MNELEVLAAEKLGKEGGLFVASDTVGNLAALLTRAQRGHEIIAEEQTHIITDERGYAFVAGLEMYRVKGYGGAMDPNDVENAILYSHSLKVDLICGKHA